MYSQTCHKNPCTSLKGSDKKLDCVVPTNALLQMICIQQNIQFSQLTSKQLLTVNSEQFMLLEVMCFQNITTKLIVSSTNQ